MSYCLDMTEREYIQHTLLDFDTRLSYAWLAGLIDGEGWVGIARNGYGPLQKSQSRKTLTPYTYHPVIAVQMTHINTIIRIGQILGFGREDGYRQKGPNWKPLHRWRVSDFEKSRHVLEIIRPYVVTKKEQVDKVIEFIDNRKFKWNKTIGHNTRPADDIEHCERYYLLLRQLNLRGNCVIMSNNAV